jgi:hypothetical protein
VTFYDKFFQFPVSERGEIARRAGMSLPYILKHIYVNNKEPRFHLHNAVALDKASGGLLHFWEHTQGDVDWDYVFSRLKEAKRSGKLTPKKGLPVLEDNT